MTRSKPAGNRAVQLQAAEVDLIQRVMDLLPPGITSRSGIARMAIRHGIAAVEAELRAAVFGHEGVDE